MSEPGVYGVGIIGIVSFRPDSGTLHNPRSTGAAPDHNVTIVINPPLRPTCLAAVIYGNRAVTRCEMDEQKLGNRVLLHIRQGVAKGVHRDRNRGMAKPLLCDLGMDTGRQHVGSVTVSKIVKAYRR